MSVLKQLLEGLEKLSGRKVALVEAKIDDYRDLYVNKKQVVSEKEFSFLSSLDKHPYPHLPWLIKQYLKDKSKSGIRELKDAFEEFLVAKSTLVNKDINYYESIIDLRYALDTRESLIKQLDTASGVKKVMKEGNKGLYAIFTKEAAQQYGAGTRWCIAALSGNMFSSYDSHSIFYFFIDGDLEKQGERVYHKIACQVSTAKNPVKDENGNTLKDNSGNIVYKYSVTGVTYWDATDQPSSAPPMNMPDSFVDYIHTHGKDIELIQQFRLAQEKKKEKDEELKQQAAVLQKRVDKARSLQTWLELDKGIPKGFVVKEKEKITHSKIRSLYNLAEVEYLDLKDCTNLVDLGQLRKAKVLIIKNTGLETLGNLEEVTDFLDIRECRNLKSIGKLRNCPEVYIDQGHPMIEDFKKIGAEVVEIA
jgi:hypothetical protein